MKPMKMYLDEAEKRGIVRNDADIATRLGVARSAVSRWRAGDRAPDDEQALALAQLLGVSEGELLAECAAARAKSPAARAAWEKIARIASTSAFFIVASASLFMTATENSYANQGTWSAPTANNTNYRGFWFDRNSLCIGYDSFHSFC